MTNRTTTLWIQNLHAAEDCRELAGIFAPYGAVREAVVTIDRDLLRLAGGLGRVQMQTRAQAEAAIASLDGSLYHGRRISVRWARRSELRRGPKHAGATTAFVADVHRQHPKYSVHVGRPGKPCSARTNSTTEERLF